MSQLSCTPFTCTSCFGFPRVQVRKLEAAVRNRRWKASCQIFCSLDILALFGYTLPVVLPYSGAHWVGRHKCSDQLEPEFELPLTASKNRPHPNSSWASQVPERQLLLHTDACAIQPRKCQTGTLCVGIARGTWDGWAPLEAGDGPYQRALTVNTEKDVFAGWNNCYSVRFTPSISAFCFAVPFGPFKVPIFVSTKWLWVGVAQGLSWQDTPTVSEAVSKSETEANDCNGLVVDTSVEMIAFGKNGEEVGLVTLVARAKGMRLQPLPQMLRDTIWGASVESFKGFNLVGIECFQRGTVKYFKRATVSEFLLFPPRYCSCTFFPVFVRRPAPWRLQTCIICLLGSVKLM